MLGVLRGVVLSRVAVSAVVLGVFTAGLAAFESAAAAASASAPDPNVDPSALAAAQQEAAQQQAYLSSPQGVAARKASKAAFTSETTAQALATDKKTFPDQVGARGFTSLDPALGTIAHKISDSEVVVKAPSGRNSLAVGSLPLYGKTVDGQSAPMDLALVDEGNMLAARSALVPLSIPKVSVDPLRFADSNFGVRFAGGTAVAGVVAGAGVFFANIGGAGSDTDAVVRAVPQGAEISYLLRSATSPEAQELTFDLPSGWKLNDPQDQSGMIEVRSGTGAVVARLLPAFAVDAQGQSVPVSYRVEDAQHLLLTVAHKQGDFAYPILVDPIVSDWNGGALGLSPWTQYKSPSNTAIYNYVGSNFDEWYGYANTAYSSGAYGESYLNSSYWAQGAYIYALTENNVYHGPNSSRFYGGIFSWNTFNWEPGTWQSSQGGSGSGADRYDPGALSNVNYTFCARPNCPSGAGSGILAGNAALAGLQLTGPTANNGVNPYMMVEEAILYLSDNYLPTIGSVQHSGYTPGTWVQNVTDTVTATATDDPSSLGMSFLSLSGASGGSVAATCGTGAVCPQSLSGQMTYSTQGMPEGINQVSVQAAGASGNTSLSAPWSVNIDRTPPDVYIDGSLYTQAAETMTGNSYDLTVDAQDALSGVTSIKIFIDGTLQQTTAVPCAGGGCELENNEFFFDISALSAGSHTVDVQAADAAGNVADHSWTINTLPNTSPDADLTTVTPPAATGTGTGCPFAQTMDLIAADNSPAVSVVNNIWTSGTSTGNETTEYFADGAYQVTRCDLLGNFLVSQLDGPVPVPPNGSPVTLVLAETDLSNGDYITTSGEYLSWDDPEFASLWQQYGAQEQASVLPPQ